MKKIIFSISLIAIISIATAFTLLPEGTEVKTLEIGKTAPEIGTMLKKPMAKS